MNKFWLKIVGCVVLALVAVVAGYIFWPAETSPIKEPKDTEHIQKEDKDSLKAAEAVYGSIYALCNLRLISV